MLGEDQTGYQSLLKRVETGRQIFTEDLKKRAAKALDVSEMFFKPFDMSRREKGLSQALVNFFPLNDWDMIIELMETKPHFKKTLLADMLHFMVTEFGVEDVKSVLQEVFRDALQSKKQTRRKSDKKKVA